MEKIQYFGWAGTALLSICGLPQALKCIREGHARGLSGLYLLLWGLGVSCLWFYVYQTYVDIPLLVDYSGNIVTVLIIARYYLYPRS